MITMMGSMGTYMKNLKLQTQFQIKQDRGELGSHKSLEDYINITNAKDLPGHENDKDREKLSGIKNKLLQGGKLTAEERKYLQAKDPEAYQKLKASEQEQKAFEQRLRQCRTKEEAQRLKMTYINSSLVTLKSVEHNSAIPQQKKLEIFMQEKQRCDRIEESSREFVRRGDYDRLPTEAEETKADKDAQEAREAQRPKVPEREEPLKPAEKRKEKPTEERPAVHVESREEKKVKRARANAHRNPGPGFTQVVAAYHANIGKADITKSKIDTKG